MKLWVLCGILTSLCWGSYVVLNKLAVSPKHYGLSNPVSGLLMGVGALLTLGAYFFATGGETGALTARKVVIGILPGCIWALGIVAVLFALSKGAHISKLALIYNTNTFVTVALAAIFLGEALDTAQLVRVLAGAVLVTAGLIVANWP